MPDRKSEFKYPTRAELLKRKRIQYVSRYNLANKLLSSPSEDQAFILKDDLTENYSSGRKFQKHAEELRLYDSTFSLQQAREMTREFSRKHQIRARSIPLHLRESAIEEYLDINSLPSGFLAHPIKGRDTTPRKYSLYYVVEGHRIFSFGGVEVTLYQDAEKVALEGARAKVVVPSRTEGREPYEFRLDREPIVDNDLKFAIGTMFFSTHQCGDKDFGLIRFKGIEKREDSAVYNVCPHEVAARLAVIENQSRNDNLVPLENSMIPLISRKFAEGAARALDSLLIQDKTKKDKVRRPRAGELEAVYWLLVAKLGAKESLYASKHRDGIIKDYAWTMRH